jgi:hypothetical protein
LIDNICPINIIRATAKSAISGTVDLLPSPLTGTNLKITANFDNIKYEVPEPVFLKLLLCKEVNSKGNPHLCPYNMYRDAHNNGVVRFTCRDEKNELAHVYFGYERPNTGIPNCIVIFIENDELRYPGNLSNKLVNTITWLKTTEDFDFYVVPFDYKNPLEISTHKRNLIKVLQKIFSGHYFNLRILGTKIGYKTLSIKHKDDRFLIEAS